MTTTRFRRHAPIFAAVAAGGAIGALARHGLAVWGAAPTTSWPWITFAENVSGCLLIGVLMAALLEATTPHRLLRPFLGVGVLGGYTTFATYAVDVQQALVDGRHLTAATYLVATPVVALLAVAVATTATRAVLRRRPVRVRGVP